MRGTVSMAGRRAAAAALCLALASPANLSAQSNEADRIWDAANVLRQIMTAEDAGVPNAVMSDVDAIAIFPSTIRGGFIFGGHRGRGIISARDVQTGEWSLPAFMTITGASFGLQIGGQATDIMLLIMNRRGLDRFLGNQFKIGADASVAAGPVGRSAAAATDLLLTAEILSYSRSRGLFAGVSLEGLHGAVRPRRQRALLRLPVRDARRHSQSSAGPARGRRGAGRLVRDAGPTRALAKQDRQRSANTNTPLPLCGRRLSGSRSAGIMPPQLPPPVPVGTATYCLPSAS